MKYQIRYSLFSHVGRQRKANQDNYLCNGRYHGLKEESMITPVTGVIRGDKCPVFGVFDGLGGEEKGEVASFLAAKAGAELLHGGSMSRDLDLYCCEANSRIWEYRTANRISRMGTTAALMSFVRDNIYLCNVGDTRIYRFDGRSLQQLSQDHAISPLPGVKGPLSQALGISPEKMSVEPFYARGNPVIGERYLLCSDGLTDMVADNEIRQILSTFDGSYAVAKLTESALHNGGRDNITILLCKVE